MIQNKTIILICAHDKHHIIGHNGKMPWYFPEDLKHFKQLTSGHTLIMGRKTYEAIGHPLANRTNIILTHQPNYSAEGCIVVHSLNEAVQKTKENSLFIIGGAEVYRQAIEFADIIYLTEINQEFNGDTTFPEFDKTQYTEELLLTTEIPYQAEFKKYTRKEKNDS